MSILGCSPEELGHVLKSLGFRFERRPLKKPKAPVAEVRPEPAMAAAEAQSTSSGTPHSEADIQPGILSAATDNLVQAETAASPPPGPGVPSPDLTQSTTETTISLEPAVAEVSALPSEAVPAAPDVAREAAPTVVEEVVFEEIWRPRRRHEQERGERRRGRSKQHGSRKDEALPQKASPQPQAEGAGERQERGAGQERGGGPERDRPRPHRRDKHKGGGERRRDDRPPMQMRSAPPPNRGEFDPDSPFAALGALKQVLQKRAQEQGSS
jgi:ATP-dependent RNA helicase SUPV3L1/SUV3